MSEKSFKSQFRCGVGAKIGRKSASLAAAMLLGSVISMASHAAPIGTPLTPVVKLSQQPYGYAFYNNLNLIARDAAGDFAVTWQIETPTSPVTVTDYIGWFSSDGTPLTSPVQLALSPVQVAMDDAGDTAVRTNCFAFAAGTCVTVYGLDGSIITPEFGLPLPGSSSTIVAGAQMAMTASGQTLFAWNNDTVQGTSYSVQTLIQSYGIDGTPIGSSQIIHQNSYTYHPISLGQQGPVALGMNRSTGTYALLFNDQESPKTFQLQIFSGAGKPISAIVQLPTGAGTLPIAIVPGAQYGAINVAVTSTGDVVCAFPVPDGSTGAPVYIYRYSARGVLKDGPNKVVAGSSTFAGQPSLWGQGLVDTVRDGFMLTYAGVQTAAQNGGTVVPLTTNVYNASDKLVKTFSVAKETLVQSDSPAAVNSVIDPQGNLRVVWGVVNTRLYQGP